MSSPSLQQVAETCHPASARLSFRSAHRPGHTNGSRKRLYIRVPIKLCLALSCATAWLAVSVLLALPWLNQLSTTVGWPLALLVAAGIALIPGSANAFLIAGLLLDRRPTYPRSSKLPPITVLICAYNEQRHIRATLESLDGQSYDGAMQVLVIDDGSTDRTGAIVLEFISNSPNRGNRRVELITMGRNGGKARALNAGLARAAHDLIVTIDGDTCLYRDAVAHLVSNQLGSPPGTAATAGTVLVRNSRKNLITKLQEWDYFLGISVVKRVQSLLQGTLVSQGAFSIYRRDVLREVGGWRNTVGEDIVLTWAMLERGYRVGYAENAFAFTNVPETYRAYYRQRKRWSRGLIEAFKHHPGLLVPNRLNTPFVYFNFTFPYLDASYLLVFVPGVIAALIFRQYAVAGLTTLLVVPLSLAVNIVMYIKQRAVFARYGLKVRKNFLGAALFTLSYQLVLAPASLAGYVAEAARRQKKW